MQGVRRHAEDKEGCCSGLQLSFFFLIVFSFCLFLCLAMQIISS